MKCIKASINKEGIITLTFTSPDPVFYTDIFVLPYNIDKKHKYFKKTNYFNVSSISVLEGNRHTNYIVELDYKNNDCNISDLDIKEFLGLEVTKL